MEVLDESDLSEEWVVLNGERENDILDEKRIIDDAEQEELKSDECLSDFNDSKMTDEELCHSEKFLATSVLPRSDERNLSSKQEECPSEGSSTPCICDELPPDIEISPAVRAYVHKRNVKLNRALNLCLILTLTAGLALGFGNFWGWFSCSSLQKYYNSEQVLQLKFEASGVPTPSEIECLQFSEKTDDLEAQHKYTEGETSTIDQKKTEFSPMDTSLDEAYSDQQECENIGDETLMFDHKSTELSNLGIISDKAHSDEEVTENIGDETSTTDQKNTELSPLDMISDKTHSDQEESENIEDEISAIDQDSVKLSPLDIISDKTHSDQEKDTVFISNIKDGNKRSPIINYSSRKEVLNAKSSIKSYDTYKPAANLMKRKYHSDKLVAGKAFDITQKALPLDIFLFCIKPSFYHSMIYQCSKYKKLPFQNGRKEQEPQKLITRYITIPPMLLDKDENSKDLKRLYLNKKVSDHLPENGQKENKGKMESIPTLRSVISETMHFAEEEDIQRWFRDHVEHIVKSTYELISLQLHQNKEFSMASSESGLNTTEKVFQELLKCLWEKLQDIQSFRSSPLFVANSYHSQKALQKMTKAIMTPVNTLLKTSAAFLVQNKPLDTKLNKLLRKILDSVQKLEYHWVEIKDKWLYMISREKQKFLHENQRGHKEGINHLNEKQSKQLNSDTTKILPKKNKDKNIDIKLKNKEGRIKNQFGNMDRNKKHANRQFEYKVKNLHHENENNGCSKRNCHACHCGMKDPKWKNNKQEVNEYYGRNADFKTSYKEINVKQQQIRIPSYGKAGNYFFVSPQ